MKNYEVIILGGGASGCMAAMTTSIKSVAIIDQDNRLAKKLLATGNGRCNLTNVGLNSYFYNQDISKYLNVFTVQDSIKFFENIGLCVYRDDEGRVYPISNSAKSVTDVIANKIAKQNTDVYLEHKILSVQKYAEGFCVKCDKQEFMCKKLVVAMGGNQAEQIIKDFGLKSRPFIPSLVALKTESTRALANTKVSNVQVVLNYNGKQYVQTGEVLFKDSGLSGIAIFNLSTILARQNDFNADIYIDLMPDITLDELVKILSKRQALNVTINKFFEGMFANPIAYEILNRCKLDETKSSITLNIHQIQQMASHIKHLNFKIKGCYDNNQVYSGGVKLESLTDNLESTTTHNLYFCGEVCDVDGECGGYNLQWAWTSGKIVGDNLW